MALQKIRTGESSGETQTTEWRNFADRLAAVLKKMRTGQFLVMSVEGTNRYIQLAVQDDGGMRIELSGNRFLEEDDRLSENDIAALTESGWNAPHAADSGSPNFYVDVIGRGSRPNAARRISGSFQNLLGVSSPTLLIYHAFESDGPPLDFPTLEIRRQKKEAGQNEKSKILSRLVATLREVTGIADLEADGDGDVMIRFGSVSICCFVAGSPAWIRFVSPLARDIRPSGTLSRKLNDINANTQIGRCFYKAGRVYFALDLPAVPYVSEQVAAAFRHFSMLADDLSVPVRSLLAPMPSEGGGRQYIQ